MHKNYFRVNTQFQNLGDALINRELIKLISSKKLSYVCIDGVPKNFLKNLDIKNNKCKLYKSTVRFFLSLIFSRLAGNRVNLFTNPGGYSGRLSKKSFLFALIMIVIYASLKLIGIKIHRIGVSYTNLMISQKFILRIQSKLLSTNYVRDSISREEAELNKINISGVVPDLAFCLNVQDSSPEQNFDYVISLRESSRNNDLIEWLDAFFKKYEGKILLCFQVEFDESFQHQLASKFAEFNPTIKNLTYSIAENVEIFRTCKYVLSNRLHVLLLAMSAGCTPIALVNPVQNKKITGIFIDNGLDEYIFDQQIQIENLPNLQKNKIKTIFNENKNKIVNASKYY